MISLVDKWTKMISKISWGRFRSGLGEAGPVKSRSKSCVLSFKESVDKPLRCGGVGD
jgi:hypothetical protein